MASLHHLRRTFPARRPSPALPLLLLATACGGASPISSPVQDPPEVSWSVEVTPATADLLPGETLQFQASVSGPAGAARDVRWTLAPIPVGSGATGSIDDTGLYRAPDVVGATSIQVTARVAASPATTAGATIRLPARSVTVSPEAAEVLPGASVQFTAAVAGQVDQRVTWTLSAPGGTVDQTGLFTAGAGFRSTGLTVTATTAAGDRGEARVEIGTLPPRLTGSSGPAAPGELVTFTATDLPPLGVCWLEFTGFDGTPVLTHGSHGAGVVQAIVPVGAASGPVRTVLPIRSLPIAFERAPLMRLRPERSEVAAGSTTPIGLAFLGAAPVPVTFDADVGAVVDGAYLAPGAVAATTHATVRACQAGTSRCTTATIAVHPFVVEPAPLLVPAGGTIQLRAEDGGGILPATFTRLSGAGACTPGGACTAAGSAATAGPLRVRVETAQGVRDVEVAVTGLVPGLLGRLVDLVDHRIDIPAGSPRWGSWAEAVAVDGTRAYVAAGPPDAVSCTYPDCPDPLPDGTPGTWWIDAYDLADPVRPRWLGAVESATKPTTLQVAAGRLVAWGAPALEAYVLDPITGNARRSAGTLAVYDLAGPLPTLLARDADAGTVDLIGPEHATLVRIFAPASSAGSFRLRWSDLSADPLAVTRELEVSAGAGCTAWEAVTDGARLYGVLSCLPQGAQVIHLSTWDLRTTPPTLVADLERLTNEPRGTLSVEGSLLFERREGFVRVFDLSGGAPTVAAVLPIGSYSAPIPAGGGRFLFGGGGADGATSGVGATLLDLSTLAAPRALATTSTGAHARPGLALLDGGLALVAEGLAGVGLYDLSPVGGPVPIQDLYGPDFVCSAALTSAVDAGGLVYVAGAGLLAPQGECATAGTFLFTWDRTSPGWPIVASAVLPFYAASAELARWPGGFLLASEYGLDAFVGGDPAAPDWLGFASLWAVSVAVQDGLAWVGTATGQLVAVDPVAAGGPAEVGTLALELPPTEIVALGNGLLAVGLGLDGFGDLVVVDASDPAAPAVLARLGLAAAVQAMDVSGSLLMAATSAGLAVVDLADPSLPRLAALVPVPSTTPWSEIARAPVVRTVRFDHGLAWAGTKDWVPSDGFVQGGALAWGFDLADPAWPSAVAVAHPPTFGSIEALVPVAGDLVALGQRSLLLDVSRPRNVVRTSEAPRALVR